MSSQLTSPQPGIQVPTDEQLSPCHVALPKTPQASGCTAGRALISWTWHRPFLMLTCWTMRPWDTLRSPAILQSLLEPWSEVSAHCEPLRAQLISATGQIPYVPSQGSPTDPRTPQPLPNRLIPGLVSPPTSAYTEVAVSTDCMLARLQAQVVAGSQGS